MMFDKLSYFLKKFFALILVALLVLSFALWGISDVFRGSGQDDFAEVGGVKISKKSIEDKALNELRNFIQIYRGEVPEYVVRMVYERVANSIVNKVLLEVESEDLGIEIGKSKINSYVKSYFQDASGEFDEESFSMFVSQNPNYFDDLKREISIEILLNSLGRISLYPKEVSSLTHEYDSEKRLVDYIIVPKNIVHVDIQPTDNELIEFYDRKKDAFVTPEYRQISFVEFSEKNVEDQISIPEEAIRSIYESQKSSFIEEKVLVLSQMFFEKKLDAEKAHSALVKGEDFIDVAVEIAGQEKNETIYGEVSENELISQRLLTIEIIDGIFALEEGGFTKPLESELGWHLFSVSGIKKSKMLSFSEAKKTIENELKIGQVNDLLDNLVGEFEDGIANKEPFEEVAESLNLQVKKTVFFDNEGKSLDGSILNDFPESDSVLEIVFLLEQDVVSQIIANSDNTKFYFIRVDDVRLPRVKALDEVRGVVISEWQKEYEENELKKLAEDISKTFKDNVQMSQDDLVKKTEELKIKLSLNNTVSRNENLFSKLSRVAVDEIFTLKEQEFSNPYKRDDGDYIIFRLKEVMSADFVDTEKLKDTENELLYQVGQDLELQYYQYLQKKHGVKTYD